MSVKPTYLVDTNILLRFLMNDQPVHAAGAKRLFDAAAKGKLSLRIPFIAISDGIFKLEDEFNIDRQDIGRELLKLLTAPGVKLTCPAWVLDAVEYYRTHNVAFGDACLAAEALAEQVTVASFDRGFDKIPNVKRHEPKG